MQKKILLQTADAIFYEDGSYESIITMQGIVNPQEILEVKVKTIDIAGYDNMPFNPTPYYVENGVKCYLDCTDVIYEI